MPADCECKSIIYMKRIFIAVKINAGKNLSDMISEMKSGLKDERIKWTEVDNFHITLVFLGDTEEDKVKAVKNMLKAVCLGSGEFNIVIKGAGVFRNLNDPRIIWTGIEPSEKLYHLHEAIKSGLNDAGISTEERNFSPHLTIGRIKSIQDANALKSLITVYNSLELQNQEVTEVILYESLLFHTGPVYKPLGRYTLGPA
jgi:RNA 2',3'-cyclic 3'-phosphodiesterase